MTVFCATFPPSKTFEDYLRAFILSYAHLNPPTASQPQLNESSGLEGDAAHEGTEVPVLPSDEMAYRASIQKMARYAYRRLRRCSRTGPRGKVPVASEVDRLKISAFYPSVFGESLETIMAIPDHLDPTHDPPVPRVLTYLSALVLARGGLTTEGLFRVPGESDCITALRLALDRHAFPPPDHPDHPAPPNDASTPASLLKLWLRELEVPLIPPAFYPRCIATATRSAAEACAVVDDLPTQHRDVAVYVIRFLQVGVGGRPRSPSLP